MACGSICMCVCIWFDYLVWYVICCLYVCMRGSSACSVLACGTIYVHICICICVYMYTCRVFACGWYMCTCIHVYMLLCIDFYVSCGHVYICIYTFACAWQATEVLFWSPDTFYLTGDKGGTEENEASMVTLTQFLGSQCLSERLSECTVQSHYVRTFQNLLRTLTRSKKSGWTMMISTVLCFLKVLYFFFFFYMLYIFSFFLYSTFSLFFYILKNTLSLYMYPLTSSQYAAVRCS